MVMKGAREEVGRVSPLNHNTWGEREKDRIVVIPMHLPCEERFCISTNLNNIVRKEGDYIDGPTFESVLFVFSRVSSDAASNSRGYFPSLNEGR